MSKLSSLLKKGVKNPFGPGDNKPGQQNEKGAESVDAYKNLKVPTFDPLTGTHADAEDVDPSAYNDITTDPSNTRAQQAQMAALSELAANGGRNAASDNNRAKIQNQENQNARGQQEAIMSRVSARGQGNSGNSILAQLSNSQNATNNQSARDQEVAAQEANTALAAGQGAASIGSNLENQQFGEGATVAGANDAVSKFNAQNKTGVNVFNAGVDNTVEKTNKFDMPQTTFQDSATKAGGVAGANNNWAANIGHQDDTQSATRAGMAGGLVKLGTSAISGMMAPAGAAGAFAATGGRIPGTPTVNGDSYANDTKPVMVSPGEVVVPRTVVNRGDSREISDFVKHPPTVDKNRTAKLSALKNLGRK